MQLLLSQPFNSLTHLVCDVVVPSQSSNRLRLMNLPFCVCSLY